jgi:ADP-ribose pyrophosphatase YjhB (NUDIX family)
MRTAGPEPLGTGPPSWPPGPRGPFPKEEFDSLFSRVPRLTVEVVVFDPERGVVLAVRDIPPNIGSLHIPGGTVRWGERVTDAYRRVALDELGFAFDAGKLLGYIEYPSHFENDLDSPVGLAFLAELDGPLPGATELPDGCAWYPAMPRALYAEQHDFLMRVLGLEAEPEPQA